MPTAAGGDRRGLTVPVFDRSPPTDVEVVDRWEEGVGWQTHPEETGRRTSHAVRGEDGVWVFDPLDGPGVDGELAELGTVAGVAILSPYHVRDAAAVADRHGVPVHLPAWMDDAARTVGAATERYDAPPGEWVELGESGIDVRTIDPPTGLREVLAYHRASGTLLVGDVLSTAPGNTVGEETIGCFFFARLAPPRSAFADLDPERIYFGHGAGVTEDAAAELESTLAGARRRLPRATVSQLPTQLAGIRSALRD